LKDFVAEVEVVNHAMVIWAEPDEVFWRGVLFVGVNVVDVDYFVEITYGTFFCDSSECF